nr:helix-turn-helix transcriptional regulator [Clostridia bacterium]
MSTKKVGGYKVPVIDLKATGQNIELLRKSAGVSVRDIQDVMGFANPQAVYKWQKGVCLPTIDNLVILAAVLDVTIDEILVYDEDPAEDISAMKTHNTYFQRITYRQ